MRIIEIQKLDRLLRSRIGARLQEIRESKGQSRQSAASQTGIPLTMIVQYELQGVLPSEYRLEQLLALYGVQRPDFIKSIKIPTWKDLQ